MKFSQREIRDITISTVVLAFAFGRVLAKDSSISAWMVSSLEALFIVGIAFLAHELLGHKLFAQRLGAAAEYRMWSMGLLLALVGSLFGFVFAAPGAVYFSTVVRGKFAFTVRRFTKADVGKVALAGPAVNIALGALFLMVFFLFPGIRLLSNAAYISFFLAFFNLLPIPPLDGSKVMAWSLPVWGISIVLAVAGYMVI